MRYIQLKSFSYKSLKIRVMNLSLRAARSQGPGAAPIRASCRGTPAGIASGHRREEPHLVARFDRGVETRQVPHVLAVDVDIDEPVEIPVGRQQLAAERRMALDEPIDDAADRLAVDVEGLDAADVGAQ